MASNNGVSSRLTRPPAGGLDPKLQALYENLEILNGARGKGMDRAVLVRDLVDLNLASVRKGAGGSVIPTKPGTGTPGAGGTEQVEPPAIPTGVNASGGFSSILIEWDKPTYLGHAYTEVYRADDDNFSNANRIATTTSNLWSDQVGTSKIHYYWVRFVNKLDIKGPLQSTEGVKGQTQEDIGDILDKLKGEIDESFLDPDFNSRIDDYGDNISKNEQGILTLDGEIVDLKSSTDILAVEGEILAEGIAEAAAGVDSEGSTRRLINAQIIKTQNVLIKDTGAMAQEISEIAVNVGENKASILETKTSIITLDQKTGEAISAVTEDIKKQQSKIESIDATVITNTTTIANVDKKTDANGNEISRVNTAITERLDQMSSTIDSNIASITQNSQTIVEVERKADGNTSYINVQAQRLTAVESNLNGVSSKVTQNSQTIASINADGSEKYKAQWGVKASIGDIVAGIGLTVKKETGKPDVSQCTVIADQFSVGNIKDGKTIYPFIVTTEGVYMDTAYIKAAKIQDLVAGEVVADNIKVGATLTAPYIKGGRIEIGSRFTVDENGNMVANNAIMNNANVSGTINATAGVFRNVTISEDCDVRGTIYANKIVGDVVSGVLKPVVENTVTSTAFTTVFSATYDASSQGIARSVFLTGLIAECSAVSSGGSGGIQIEARILVNGVEVARKKINAGLTRSESTGDEGGTVIGYFNGSDTISGGKYVGFAGGSISAQIRVVNTGWFDGATYAKVPDHNVMLQLVPIGEEFN